MAVYLELYFRMKSIRKYYSNKESQNLQLRCILKRAIRHDKITNGETSTKLFLQRLPQAEFIVLSTEATG